MSNVFFIHGTGVRDGYFETLDAIRKGFAHQGRQDLEISGVDWGNRLGTDISDDLIRKFLPEAGSMGIGLAMSDAELEAATWELLDDDELFELRVLAISRDAPQATAIGQETPDMAMERRVREMDIPEGDVLGGLDPRTLKAARDWMVTGEGAEALSEAALAAGSALDGDLVTATARAIVAKAFSEAEPDDAMAMGQGPDILYDPDMRDALVARLEVEISEGAMGLKGELTKLVLKFATKKARKSRFKLMKAVSPFIGDILLTQRRGEAIRSLIKEEIETLDAPVTILAHSLGGELAVDLITSGDRPSNIERLITVGSQPGFFGAADSLGDLRLVDGTLILPDDFPQWVNIFDRSDLLSFRAGEFFVGAGGVTDEEIRSKTSFPKSHGAYWHNRKVYERLSELIPR